MAYTPTLQDALEADQNNFQPIQQSNYQPTLQDALEVDQEIPTINHVSTQPPQSSSGMDYYKNKSLSDITGITKQDLKDFGSGALENLQAFPLDTPISEGLSALKYGVDKSVPVFKSVVESPLKVLEYLNPKKDIQNFMTNLSGGSTTTEGNAANLASRIQMLHDFRVNQAIQPLQDVLDNVGDKSLVDGNTGKFDSYVNQYSDESVPGKALQKLHDNYIKNPTFNNSFELRKGINNSIGKIDDLRMKSGLTNEQSDTFDQLSEMKDTLNGDQNNFLSSVNPEYSDKFKTFNNYWKNNVVPYRSNDLFNNIVKGGPQGQGSTQGIKSSQISNVFNSPTEYVQKVMQDIGQPGLNNVVYNEIQHVKPGDINAIVDQLNKMSTSGGFSQSVNPDLISQAEGLSKRKSMADKFTTLKGLRDTVGIPAATLGGATYIYNKLSGK